MATKLKSDSLSPNEWWKLLKYFRLLIQNRLSPPPLETDGQIYAEECEKANVLNDFFKNQSLLDEINAEIPDIHSYPVDSPLSNIVLTSDEVESVLKSLPDGKAVGPDGISNHVLKNLVGRYLKLYVVSLTNLLVQALSQTLLSRLMSAQCIKVVIHLKSQTIDLNHF